MSLLVYVIVSIATAHSFSFFFLKMRVTIDRFYCLFLHLRKESPVRQSDVWHLPDSWPKFLTDLIPGGRRKTLYTLPQVEMSGKDKQCRLESSGLSNTTAFSSSSLGYAPFLASWVRKSRNCSSFHHWRTEQRTVRSLSYVGSCDRIISEHKLHKNHH